MTILVIDGFEIINIDHGDQILFCFQLLQIIQQVMSVHNVCQGIQLIHLCDQAKIVYANADCNHIIRQIRYAELHFHVSTHQDTCCNQHNDQMLQGIFLSRIPNGKNHYQNQIQQVNDLGNKEKSPPFPGTIRRNGKYKFIPDAADTHQ